MVQNFIVNVKAWNSAQQSHYMLKLFSSKKLSQQKLADILHVSQQSIYKYENGITSPDLETLTNMANFFDTSIDYLVGLTNDRDDKKTNKLA